MTHSFRPWTSRPDNNLSDHLDMHYVGMLREMVNYLPIAKPYPTRKVDMIAAIVDQLTDDYLRELWDNLGEKEQLVVRETLYDPDGELDREQFAAKYGNLPAGFGNCSKYMSSSLSSVLYFFVYPQSLHALQSSVIPADLKERLHEFVPPPPEEGLVVEKELPESVRRFLRRYVPPGEEPECHQVELIRRDMEQAAPRDLSVMLRLVDLGKVAVSNKTRRPSALTIRRISDELDGGDFFGPDDRKYYVGQGIGAIRAFAWPLLLQAGRLVKIHGSKLALTKAGRTAFSAPPAETLRHLWNRWITNGILDEFSRIDTISGQRRGRRVMTAVSGRRPVVADALERCPVGHWVRFSEFSRFMLANRHTFEITHDPEKLYIAESYYGNLGRGDYYEWELLQDRYTLCLLFEYAATLGLIDVVYTDPEDARSDFTDLVSGDSLRFLSRYDGLEYFRLNPLGAYCLGISKEYEPPSLPDRTPLQVFPDRRLCADRPLSSEERLTLETWANAEVDGVWRLDRGKILDAIEHGHDVDDLRAFLAERDDQPLPERVEGFLRSVGQGGTALRKRGRALLVECASEEIAVRLATDKHISKMCLPAGKKHLAVHAKSEAAFRKAIRGLGLGMPWE